MEHEIWMSFLWSQDDSVQAMLKGLGLKFKGIKTGSTRYPYDNSDYSSWVLDYTDVSHKEIKADMRKLESIKIFGKSIFNVSGNGYGTGISLMMKNIIFKPSDVLKSIQDGCE